MICDWHGCVLIATHAVRRDVARGDGFTSLVWHRCGSHTPISRTAREGLSITVLERAS